MLDIIVGTCIYIGYQAFHLVWLQSSLVTVALTKLATFAISFNHL